MPCIDLRVAVLGLGLLLGACATPVPPDAPAPPSTSGEPPPLPPVEVRLPAVPTPPVAAAPSPAAVTAAPPPAPAPAAAAPPRVAQPPAAAAAAPPRRVVALGPAQAARNWAEFRQQAARRLVQAHPDGSYTGPVPEPLLAIPVLEVELHADGRVRRVQVLRHPRQARDTTQLAIDAVHRAAPYGAMSRLPLPWKWTEVFLFDEQRRFKPRELDQ